VVHQGYEVFNTIPYPVSDYDVTLPKVQRHNVELQFILSVLTAGPVGIADEINKTNVTRTLQSCSSNGTLLQPDKQATPIDAMFASSSPARHGARLPTEIYTRG
jgi:hypothetical protein